MSILFMFYDVIEECQSLHISGGTKEKGGYRTGKELYIVGRRKTRERETQIGIWFHVFLEL